MREPAEPSPQGQRLVAAGSWMLAGVLRGLIRVYQLGISPLIGPRCRFQPTCSQYALDAIRLHGGLRGSLLAIKRIARCHPLGGHGYDPVPGQRPAHQSDSASDQGPCCG